jgi:polyphosphate kinase 2 (PPK2 family)
VFDRSWYGRVLVERVEEIASKREWQRGYEEINQFERMLVADGIRRNASRAWPLGHR